MDDANASMNLHPVPVLPMSICIHWERGGEFSIPDGETVYRMPSEIWILSAKGLKPLNHV